MGVVSRIPDEMYLLGVRVKYARVGCTLRIGGVNVTRKPQILILTQSTHHTSVRNTCRDASEIRFSIMGDSET